jgi:hypothetical protein
MSSIVENQKLAFLARAQDDARRLCSSLANLSDAQRAAILALIAAKTSTPIDIGYIADTGDAELIREIVSGTLRVGDWQNTYLLGSGCDFTVTPAPGSERSYE